MNENIKQVDNKQNINYTFTSAIVQSDCQIHTITTDSVNKKHESKKTNLKRTFPTDEESHQQIRKLQKTDYEQCPELNNAIFIQKPQFNENQIGVNIKPEDQYEEKTLHTKDSTAQQYIKSIKGTEAKNVEHSQETETLQKFQKPNSYKNPFRQSEEKTNLNKNPFGFLSLKAELDGNKSLQNQKRKKRSHAKKRKRGNYKYANTEQLKQINFEQQNASNNLEPAKMYSVEDDILNNGKFETCPPIALQKSVQTKYLRSRQDIEMESSRDDVEQVQNEEMNKQIKILIQQQNKNAESTQELQNKQNKNVNLKRKKLSGAQRKRLKKLLLKNIDISRDDMVPLQEVGRNISDKNEILTQQQNKNAESTEQNKQDQEINLKRKKLSGAQKRRLRKLLKLRGTENFKENEFVKSLSSNQLQPQKSIENFKDSDIKSSLDQNCIINSQTQISNTLKLQQNENPIRKEEIYEKPTQNEFTSAMKENLISSSPFTDTNVESKHFIKQEPKLEPCDYYTPSLISPINLQTIKTDVLDPTKADSKNCEYQVFKWMDATTEFREDEFKCLSPPPCTSKDVQLYQQSDLPRNNDINFLPKNRETSAKVKVTESGRQRNTRKQRKRVSITSDSLLGKNELVKLENAILDEIIKTQYANFTPAFCGSWKEFGSLVIVCANMESRSWLEKVIANIQPWPGAKFNLTDGKKAKRIIVRFWIPNDIKSTSHEILRRLEIQNPRLSTTGWKVISRKVGEKGQTLFVSIDKNSKRILGEVNNKLFLNLSKVHINFVNSSETMRIEK